VSAPRARGEEVWRLEHEASVATCELWDGSPARTGWDALLLHDDNVVVTLRGLEAAQARLTARSWRQNYIASGWAVHAPEQSWVVLGEHVVDATWCGSVDGTWTPDASLIAVLLPPLMATLQIGLDEVNAWRARVPGVTAEPAFHVSDYLVQCVGIVRAGRRLVAVIGFHGWARNTEGMADRWLTTPMVGGRDGGWDHFCATYDPATQQIEGFRFNHFRLTKQT
jgi:hypothetical protein